MAFPIPLRAMQPLHNTHTDEHHDTREQANKAAGKEIIDKSTVLLLTPIDHNGKRYHRRAICGFRTIYFDSIQLKPTEKTS